MCGRCVMIRNPTSLSRYCSYYPYRSTANTSSSTHQNYNTTNTTCSFTHQTCNMANTNRSSSTLKSCSTINANTDTCTTELCEAKSERMCHSPIEPYWFKRCDEDWNPSYNICPRDYLPVLLSTSHSHASEVSESACCEDRERMFQLMQWGLVPSWHRGSPSSFSVVLNNCRSDGIMEKPCFRNAYSKGRRCVIPVDGFYEWQSKSGTKQPYYIHSPDRSEMLMIAGIFDIHNSRENGAHFTVTMITTEADTSFSHIHHRMPALLLDSKAVSDWLDFKRVSGRDVFKLISSSFKLEWYPVGKFVSDVRYKGEKCIELVNENTKPKSKPARKVKDNNETPSKTLYAFFNRTPVKRPLVKDEEDEEVKRQKKDFPEE